MTRREGTDRVVETVVKQKYANVKPTSILHCTHNNKVYNTSAAFEKISPYECGFNPFEDSRNQFDISFYLIGILFIIFDLEVSFLFPWVLALNHINIFGFLSMLVFLVVLTIGFIYEWFSGALDFA